MKNLVTAFTALICAATLASGDGIGFRYPVAGCPQAQAQTLYADNAGHIFPLAGGSAKSIKISKKFQVWPGGTACDYGAGSGPSESIIFGANNCAHLDGQDIRCAKVV